MSESFLERMGTYPIVISILMFDALASFLTLINPAGLIFVSDIYIALGMVMGSVFILYSRKKDEKLDLIGIIKTILLLAIFGGITVAVSLSLLFYLLGSAAGIAIPFFTMLISYIRISVSISLGIGILVFIVFFSLIKLAKINGKERTSQG
ncbi:MAG: hypothetical protein ACFFAE_07740 [Candidatus Hodarchaeota archaeon]